MSRAERLVRLLDESARAFHDFGRRHHLHVAVFGYGDTKPETVGAWREWMMSTAHPKNREIQALLKDMFPDQDSEPAIVRRFHRYVDLYGDLITKWMTGMESANHVDENFPYGLDTFAKRLV